MNQATRGLDFEDLDAVGNQPVAHGGPRVGLSLLPRPHAPGGNNQNGGFVAVGGRDDARQVGAGRS